MRYFSQLIEYKMIIKTVLGLFYGVYLSSSIVIKTNGFYDAMDLIQKDVDYMASLMVSTSSPECNQCADALTIYEAWSNEVNGIVKVLDYCVILGLLN